MTQRKKHDRKVARLNYLASQRILIQRKPAETLAHALHAAFLVQSLNRACKEVCKVSGERVEFGEKWERAYRVDKGWSASAKRVVKEMFALLTQALDAVLQFKKDHEERLAV